MEEKPVIVVTPPPRIAQVYKEAFDLVSHHVELMILPMLLDLMLLFCPRLRISVLLERLFGRLASASANISTAMAAQYAQLQEVSEQLIRSFNLLGGLHTLPIGVPSLFGFDTPLYSPLGPASDIQLTSVPLIVLLFVLLSVTGLILGGLFHSIVAGVSCKGAAKRSPELLAKLMANYLLMLLALAGVCIILAIPYTCIMSISVMTTPTLAGIIAVILLVVIIWGIIPFFFTPHGIFVHGYSLSEALKASTRFAGWGTMTTIAYIFLSIGLSVGMDLIWTIPQADSWLLLFSIFGHAFIETSIIAAGFILYEKYEKWIGENPAYMEHRNMMLQRSLRQRRGETEKQTEIQTDDEENE